jgi:Glycosyl transferase family 2
MTDARVTAVIPTVGRPSLRNALMSVREQTEPTHCVVVLDRPEREPDVRATAEAFGAELVVNPRSGGAACRNVGAAHTRTPYLAYLDDDDWWEPSKVASQVDCFEADDEAALVSTYYSFHRRNGVVHHIPGRLPRDGETVASYLTVRDSILFGGSCLQSSGLMVRTGAALRVGWDESLGKHQDWDFVIRVLANSFARLVWVPQPLTHVLQGSGGSVSRAADWEASLRWLSGRAALLSRRARADFVCTHVLRAALATRSGRGVYHAVRTSTGSFPHAAALVVGLAGLRGI